MARADEPASKYKPLRMTPPPPEPSKPTDQDITDLHKVSLQLGDARTLLSVVWARCDGIRTSRMADCASLLDRSISKLHKEIEAAHKSEKK